MNRGKKGQLLILVMGVMGIGLLVIAPLLAYVDLSLRLSMSQHSRTSAYYAAETGVELVIGDLYMGQDVLTGSYFGTANGYDYDVTVSVPLGNDTYVEAGEAYFDPGVSLAMRPMDDNPPGDTHEYPFVVLKGKDVEVNWAAYTSNESKFAWDTNPATRERLDITIELWRGAPNSSFSELIATSRTTPEEQYASNEARMIANTLYVPGELIEGGVYFAKFINDATRDASSALACSQHFSRAGDQLYIFNGSITQNCDHFINDGGEITLMVINEDNGDASGEVNTFSFFCDYVELTITAQDSEGNISVNTYTYEDVEESDSGNNSYIGCITTTPGTADEGKPGSSVYHSPSIYGGDFYGDGSDLYAPYLKDLGPPQLASQVTNFSELTDERYMLINSSDGNRILAGDPVLDGERNACLWHIFTIDEDPDEVIQIDIHWEGYQAKASPTFSWSFLWWSSSEIRDDDELYLLMWNYEEDGGADPNDGLDGKYHMLERKEQDAGYTWVKILQGGYADYLVTSTSSRDGEDEVTVTAYVRQVPGPSVWWEEQIVDILSWNVHIH